MPLGKKYPEHLPPLPAGYEYVKEIAAGAQGAVWLVLNKNMGVPGRREAVKILQHINEKEYLRFCQEISTLATLNHPNIVTIYYANPGQSYFVMEYLDGGSLQAFVRDKNFSLVDGIHIIIQIAEGLHFAHSKGLIHRDLKPQNILFTSTRVPKITDFGIVKAISLEAQEGITSPQISLGTPHYISPEQWEDSKMVDYRSDIWSLGIILYQMLARRLPFEGVSISNLMYAATMKSITLPRIVNPSLSPLGMLVEPVCMQALVKNREKRYQSALEVAQALSDVLEKNTTPGGSETINVSPEELMPVAEEQTASSPTPETQTKPRVNFPVLPPLVNSGKGQSVPNAAPTWNEKTTRPASGSTDGDATMNMPASEFAPEAFHDLPQNEQPKTAIRSIAPSPVSQSKPQIANFAETKKLGSVGVPPPAAKPSGKDSLPAGVDVTVNIPPEELLRGTAQQSQENNRPRTRQSQGSSGSSILPAKSGNVPAPIPTSGASGEKQVQSAIPKYSPGSHDKPAKGGVGEATVNMPPEEFLPESEQQGAGAEQPPQTFRQAIGHTAAYTDTKAMPEQKDNITPTARFPITGKNVGTDKPRFAGTRKLAPFRPVNPASQPAAPFHPKGDETTRKADISLEDDTKKRISFATRKADAAAASLGKSSTEGAREGVNLEKTRARGTYRPALRLSQENPEDFLPKLLKNAQDIWKKLLVSFKILCPELDLGYCCENALSLLESELANTDNNDMIYRLLLELLGERIIESTSPNPNYMNNWSKLEIAENCQSLLLEQPCKIFFFLFRFLAILLYSLKSKMDMETKSEFAHAIVQTLETTPDLFLVSDEKRCDLTAIFEHCRKHSFKTSINCPCQFIKS